MTTAREVFISRRLARRYGVIGHIAGRYVEAGLSVRIGVKTPMGVVDIVAKGSNGVMAVTVVNGSVKVTGKHVEEAAKKAEALKAKPILALYGRGPLVTREAVEKARELGVTLKRVRY